MDTQPTSNPSELLSHIVGDIANALVERDSLFEPQRSSRAQAAADTMMQFQPSDAVQAMLAGHCVMFHALILDSIPACRRGDEIARRAARGGIVAMDKAFGANLARLERCQQRQAEPAAPPAEARTETEIADRLRRHQSRTPPAPAATPTQAIPEPESVVPHYPTPEVIAACLAIPEVKASLEAEDPLRFAKALGWAEPSEEYLAAAPGLMAGFNREAAGYLPSDPQPVRPTRSEAATIASATAAG